MKNYHQVVQLLPTLSTGDAVSNSALAIQKLTSSLGKISKIIAYNIHPELASVCEKLPQSLSELDAKDSLLIYHLSIGCPETHKYFHNWSGKKGIIYHNVTPSYFFEPYDPNFSKLLDLGRAQLHEAAVASHFILADSEYNLRDIDPTLQVPKKTVPILTDFFRLKNTRPDQILMNSLTQGSITNILCVGRLAPNKGIEDVIRVFYHYNTYANSNSRLILVGSSANDEYHKILLDIAKQLKIQERIEFLGHVDDSKLAACYQTADAYISMSEHEGFCIPLLEAMTFNIPVFAYDSGAVASTTGAGALVFKTKDFPLIANAIAFTLKNEAWKNHLAAKRFEHVNRMVLPNLCKSFQETLTEVLQ